MERRLSGILRSYDILIRSDDELLRTVDLLSYLGVRTDETSVLKNIVLKLKCTPESKARIRVVGNNSTRRLIIPTSRRDAVDILHEYHNCTKPKAYPGYGCTDREVLRVGCHVVPKIPYEMRIKVSGIYCSVLRGVGTNDSLHCTYCDLYRCDCTLYNFCTPRTIENELIFVAV